jgi:hypothetical protein
MYSLLKLDITNSHISENVVRFKGGNGAGGLYIAKSSTLFDSVNVPYTLATYEVYYY